MLRSLLALWLLGVCYATPAWAQQPKQPPKASLKDCVRQLGRDSLVLYYSPAYVLTPPGCADIRRHAHIPDSAGRFNGPVRDYALANNLPVLEGAYNQGLKEGLFTLYHPTGGKAAQGTYSQGLQTGRWTYWYPSGKWRQVLDFGTNGLPTVRQFQDEQGQRLVKDGNGTWYRDEDGMRLRGTVTNGIPDGLWELRQLKGNQRVADEKFKKNHFRFGRNYEGDEYYNDKSRFYLTDWEDYSQAEKLVVNPPCPPEGK